MQLVSSDVVQDLIQEADGWIDSQDLYRRYCRRSPIGPESSSFLGEFQKALDRMVRFGLLRSKPQQTKKVYNLPE